MTIRFIRIILFSMPETRESVMPELYLTGKKPKRQTDIGAKQNSSERHRNMFLQEMKVDSSMAFTIVSASKLLFQMRFLKKILPVCACHSGFSFVVRIL